VRVWTLDGEVLIASITSQAAPDQPGVIEGLSKAVELAEAGYQGLVIWSPDDVFSAGANLESLMPVFMKSGAKGIAPEIKKLQDADAAHPLCAGAGGGGDARHRAGRRLRAGGALRQARGAMETYIGLVEVGVGLIPAAAAWPTSRAARPRWRPRPMPMPTSEVRDRRLHQCRDGQGGHQRDRAAQAGLPAVERRGRAAQGRAAARGLAQAKAMADSGWRAPPAALFPVAGRNAIATIQASWPTCATAASSARTTSTSPPDRRGGVRR
jgi:3-hydroxyacyl-CoA dehydrogenase